MNPLTAKFLQALQLTCDWIISKGEEVPVYSYFATVTDDNVDLVMSEVNSWLLGFWQTHSSLQLEYLNSSL